MQFQIPFIDHEHAGLTGRSRARYAAKRLATFSSIARKLADRCWPFELTQAGLAFEPRGSDKLSNPSAVRNCLQGMGVAEPFFCRASPTKKPGRTVCSGRYFQPFAHVGNRIS